MAIIERKQPKNPWDIFNDIVHTLTKAQNAQFQTQNQVFWRNIPLRHFIVLRLSPACGEGKLNYCHLESQGNYS